MPTSIPLELLGPQTSFRNARLHQIKNLIHHPLLARFKPREEWVFETELESGHWELVSCYFPKWKHPHSARTKFLTQWLREELRPEMLDDPKLLVGHPARLEISTSFDSDEIMSRRIIAARATPDPATAPGP
jgi:hypothetical protein